MSTPILFTGSANDVADGWRTERLVEETPLIMQTALTRNVYPQRGVSGKKDLKVKVKSERKCRNHQPTAPKKTLDL